MPKFSAKRKFVGIAVILFAAAFFGAITLFTLEINEFNSVLHKDCPLPANICPYDQPIHTTSAIAYILDALLFVFGAYLLLRKEEALPQKNGLRKIGFSRKAKIPLDKLEPDERKLVSAVQEAGAIFQSELVEKTGFGKVKVTRILDRLEAKGILERKRRGMTNIVVIKQ